MLFILSDIYSPCYYPLYFYFPTNVTYFINGLGFLYIYLYIYVSYVYTYLDVDVDIKFYVKFGINCYLNRLINYLSTVPSLL